MARACCWFSSEQDLVCQGLLFFELDYFLWRLCGWVEQQIRKETCDHITECKAKWIVLAIGGESSEYTCAGGI